MLALSQAPGGGALATRRSYSPPLTFTTPNPRLFSNPRHNLVSSRRPPSLRTLSKADDAVESTPASKMPQAGAGPTSGSSSGTVFVGQENVPLEGVIQFDKPSTSSRVEKWGRVALFSGGDVLALLLFSAIGRFSHGFPVFDMETLRTADPFVAGWFLGAYFLGGYGENGRGMNGVPKGVIASAKSWAVGIPLGIAIRTALSGGHIPAYTFILVTMGSTAVLLIGWRALLYSLLPGDQCKKNDVYRKGNPFELLELLTSLVRRW